MSSDNSSPPMPSVSPWRWLRRMLWTGFALIVIVLGLLVGLLNSSLGSVAINYAIERVNWISVEAIDGSVFNGMRWTNLHIAHPAITGQISQIDLAISSHCLWQKHICLEQLFVESATLALADSTTINLTNWSAPMHIDLQHGVVIHPTAVTGDELHVYLPDPEVAPTVTQSTPAKFDFVSKTDLIKQIDAQVQALFHTIQHYQTVLSDVTSSPFDPQHFKNALPELDWPIYAEDIHLSIASVIVVQNQVPVLPESALSSTLAVTDDLNLQALSLSNRQWSVQGDLTLTTEYQVSAALSLQTNALSLPIENLQFELKGSVLSPYISFATEGLLHSRGKVKIDLTDPSVPVDLALSWDGFKSELSHTQIDLAPGSLALQGNRNQARANVDAALTSLIHNDELAVQNARLDCGFEINLTQLNSQQCRIGLGNTTLPLHVSIEAKDSLTFSLATQLALNNQSDLFQWRIQGKPLIEYLQGFNLDAYHADILITHNSLNLSHTLTGELNQPLSLQHELEAELVSDTVQLNIPKLHLTFGSDAIDLAPFNSKLTTQQLDLSPLQITFSSAKGPFSSLLLTPEPIVFELMDLGVNIAMTDTAVVDIISLVNTYLTKPITLETDASVALDTDIQWQGNQLIAETQMGVTPSKWILSPTLEFVLEKAQIKGDVLWDTQQPINKAQVRSRGQLTGQNLGEIGLEIDYLDSLAIYAQMKAVQLSVFADLVPMFEDFTGLASANIALRQYDNDLHINGVVIVPELNLKLDKLPESHVQPNPDIVFTNPQKQVFNLTESDKFSLPYGINLDINAIIDPLKKHTVRLNAFDFATSLHGALNVRLEGTNLAVLGDLNLNDGLYQAYGQDLLVRRGVLNFTGPVGMPYISLEAIRNPKTMNEDVIAGIRVQGLSQNLRAELFSEPEFENPNILSYLIRGKGLNAASDENSSVVITNALLGFGLGQSESALSRFGSALGVEDLQLSTEGAGDQTQIGVSGKLNERLSVEYRVGVFEEIAEWGLRYQYRPNIYIEATSGAHNALDIFYQLAWGTRADTESQKSLESMPREQ